MTRKKEIATVAAAEVASSELVQRQIDGSRIDQRRSDGYVNATALCRAAGKRWSNYWRLSSTKEFLADLSLELDVPIGGLTAHIRAVKTPLIDSREGRPLSGGGTWVHPRVAQNLAQWLHPRYAVAVSGWLEELRITGFVALSPATTGAPSSLADMPLVVQQAFERAMQIVAGLGTAVGATQTDLVRIGDATQAHAAAIARLETSSEVALSTLQSVADQSDNNECEIAYLKGEVKRLQTDNAQLREEQQLTRAGYAEGLNEVRRELALTRRNDAEAERRAHTRPTETRPGRPTFAPHVPSPTAPPDTGPHQCHLLVDYLYARGRHEVADPTIAGQYARRLLYICNDESRGGKNLIRTPVVSDNPRTYVFPAFVLDWFIDQLKTGRETGDRRDSVPRIPRPSYR